MAKAKQVNVLHNVLMLFVFLVPVIGSGFEKRAVTYAALCALLVCIGYRICKSASLVFTKTFMFMTGISLYGLLQLLWVSDKGSHFALCSLFLMSGAGCLLVSDYKKQIGKENFNAVSAGIIYVGSLIYAVMAVLYQVFIKSSFLGCNMDFGNGSPAATACVMIVGITAAFEVFKKQKKQLSFFVPVFIMTYVFLMTKSLLGYLFGAVIVFCLAMTKKHKKVEAFIALVAAVVLGVLNGISAVANLVRNSETFNGAMRGLVSIIGVGQGGYNASLSVVGKGYEGNPPVADLMMEAFGVAGILIIAVGIWSLVRYCMRTRRFEDIMPAVLAVTVLFTNSASLIFMLPFICMYCAAREEGVTVSVNKFLSAAAFLPGAFYLILTLAHIPYAIADHYCDIEQYRDSAECYSIGAKMELFNSEGWEKAYEAEQKAFEQSGYAPARSQFLNNAVKYNKKNYMYLRQLADVYTSEGDYQKALDTWDIIMLRHDKEYLYPMYCEKILDVMQNCSVGLEKMEELYQRLDECAKKAVDKDIVFETNNILAKSQQYYINTREGNVTLEDVYYEAEEAETEESAAEVEYESSSAESQ